MPSNARSSVRSNARSTGSRRASQIPPTEIQGGNGNARSTGSRRASQIPPTEIQGGNGNARSTGSRRASQIPPTEIQGSFHNLPNMVQWLQETPQPLPQGNQPARTQPARTQSARSQPAGGNQPARSQSARSQSARSQSARSQSAQLTNGNAVSNSQGRVRNAANGRGPALSGVTGVSRASEFTPSQQVQRQRIGNAGTGARVFRNRNGQLLPTYREPLLLNRVQTRPSTACVSAARTTGSLGSPDFLRSFNSHMRSLTASYPRNVSICGQNRLAIPQLRVYELAKVMSMGLTPDRGQLVWANTGGGKTLIALAVLLAYWDSEHQLFVVTTPDNKSSNDATKYVESIKTFFPAIAQALWESVPQRNNSTPDQRLQQAFDNRVTFLSFETFSHMLGFSGSGPHMFVKWQRLKTWWDDDRKKGGVFIFDEAHGLIEGMGTKAALMKAVGKHLRELTDAKRKRMHVWALTATPGKTIRNWVELLSILRRSNDTTDFSAGSTAQIAAALANRSTGSLESFYTQHVRGIISYLENRANLRDHACVKSETMAIPSDIWYYMAMLRALMKTPSPERNRTSMFVVKGEYSSDLIPKRMLDILEKHRRFLAHGKLVSLKFALMVRYLIRKPGKHFVYTSSSAKEIAEALETWAGFRNVSTEATLEPFFTTQRSPPPLRGSDFTWTGTSKQFLMLSGGGNETAAQKRAKFRAFNAKANVDGKYVKIVIATGQAYEGTDLKALRHVHLVEPMPSGLQERQAVGRGVRFCSHTDIEDERERNVAIVRWYLMPPPASEREEMLDAVVRSKKTVTKKFEDLLVAIGTLAGKYGNVGPEYTLRKERLAEPTQVALSNFEMFMALRASGSARSFQPSDTFKIFPGKKCR